MMLLNDTVCVLFTTVATVMVLSYTVYSTTVLLIRISHQMEVKAPIVAGRVKKVFSNGTRETLTASCWWRGQSRSFAVLTSVLAQLIYIYDTASDFISE